MPATTALTPILAAPCAAFAVEALEAGRSPRGLQASVRATDGRRVVWGPDVVHLAEADDRRRAARAILQAVDPTTPGAPSAGGLEAALGILHGAVEAALRGPARGAGAAGQPAPAGATGGGQGTGGAPGHPYAVEGGRLVWRKPIPGGHVDTVLANFAAVITRERLVDDGANAARSEWEVRGALADGRPLPAVWVPAARFASLAWVSDHWGTRAVVAAGVGAREHARAAIQLLSGAVPRRVTFAHSGWRRLEGGSPGVTEGAWAYLHAGGGITGDGALPAGTVDVALGGNLRLLDLPAPPPPDSPELVQAVRASLALRRVAPDRVVVPLLGAVGRAPLASVQPVDVAVFLVGRSGVFKSELTALAQAHFGAGFDRKHLPGEWSATANYLERLLFEARDALCVVDDYAPGGTPLATQKLQEAAGRVVRGVGNASARGRMAADTSLRPSYPPRGLLLSSGEDAPAGGTDSVAARVLAVEVEPGDVRVDELGVAQARAREGWYARALAGYLQWLAARLDGEADRVAAEFAALRAAATASGQHRRVPEAVANLALGWGRYLAFALERGCVTGAEHDELVRAGWAALGAVAADQRQGQGEQDPVVRFAAALVTALGSGQAHVAGPDGEAPALPNDPRAWGWRRQVVGAGDYRHEEWRPQGARIGWVDGPALYLQAGAAYLVAETVLHRSGQALGVREVTLKKRLQQAGVLAGTEQRAGQTRLEVRVTLEGARRAVLHVPAGWLAGEPGDSVRGGLPSGEKVAQVAQVAQAAGEAAGPQEGAAPAAPIGGGPDGPLPGPLSEPAPQKWPPEVAHDGGSPQEGGGNRGPLGPLGPLSPTTDARAAAGAAPRAREERTL
jgi:hypothetical protein